jgi:hypothetical protein
VLDALLAGSGTSFLTSQIPTAVSLSKIVSENWIKGHGREVLTTGHSDDTVSPGVFSSSVEPFTMRFETHQITVPAHGPVISNALIKDFQSTSDRTTVSDSVADTNTVSQVVVAVAAPGEDNLRALGEGEGYQVLPIGNLSHSSTQGVSVQAGGPSLDTNRGDKTSRTIHRLQLRGRWLFELNGRTVAVNSTRPDALIIHVTATVAQRLLSRRPESPASMAPTTPTALAHPFDADMETGLLLNAGPATAVTSGAAGVVTREALVEAGSSAAERWSWRERYPDARVVTIDGQRVVMHRIVDADGAEIGWATYAETARDQAWRKREAFWKRFRAGEAEFEHWVWDGALKRYVAHRPGGRSSRERVPWRGSTAGGDPVYFSGHLAADGTVEVLLEDGSAGGVSATGLGEWLRDQSAGSLAGPVAGAVLPGRPTTVVMTGCSAAASLSGVTAGRVIDQMAAVGLRVYGLTGPAGVPVDPAQMRLAAVVDPVTGQRAHWGVSQGGATPPDPVRLRFGKGSKDVTDAAVTEAELQDQVESLAEEIADRADRRVPQVEVIWVGYGNAPGKAGVVTGMQRARAGLASFTRLLGERLDGLRQVDPDVPQVGDIRMNAMSAGRGTPPGTDPGPLAERRRVALMQVLRPEVTLADGRQAYVQWARDTAGKPIGLALYPQQVWADLTDRYPAFNPNRAKVTELVDWAPRTPEPDCYQPPVEFDRPWPRGAYVVLAGDRSPRLTATATGTALGLSQEDLGRVVAADPMLTVLPLETHFVMAVPHAGAGARRAVNLASASTGRTGWAFLGLVRLHHKVWEGQMGLAAVRTEGADVPDGVLRVEPTDHRATGDADPIFTDLHDEPFRLSEVDFYPVIDLHTHRPIGIDLATLASIDRWSSRRQHHYGLLNNDDSLVAGRRWQPMPLRHRVPWNASIFFINTHGLPGMAGLSVRGRERSVHAEVAAEVLRMLMEKVAVPEDADLVAGVCHGAGRPPTADRVEGDVAQVEQPGPTDSLAGALAAETTRRVYAVESVVVARKLRQLLLQMTYRALFTGDTRSVLMLRDPSGAAKFLRFDPPANRMTLDDDDDAMLVAVPVTGVAGPLSLPAGGTGTSGSAVAADAESSTGLLLNAGGGTTVPAQERVIDPGTSSVGDPARARQVSADQVLAPGTDSGTGADSGSPSGWILVGSRSPQGPSSEEIRDLAISLAREIGRGQTRGRRQPVVRLGGPHADRVRVALAGEFTTLGLSIDVDAALVVAAGVEPILQDPPGEPLGDGLGLRLDWERPTAPDAAAWD